jgi:hypothetical protein
MTRKIYKSAMGKAVDLGALLLQNEQVRAVGNMGVNAAGDVVDSTNRVIDQRNRQVQRQYKRQTNVSSTPIATSNLSARKMQADLAQGQESTEPEIDLLDPAPVAPVREPVPVTNLPGSGGLAAAIARSREVKQELEKTMRDRAQEPGVRKI